MSVSAPDCSATAAKGDTDSSGGTGTVGQGYDGQDQTSSEFGDEIYGGTGGGASAAGAYRNPGDGVCSTILGAPIEFGGGGGGGGWKSGSLAIGESTPGGTSGGGEGAGEDLYSLNDAEAGINGTGGGGGGHYSGLRLAGNGGNGVVILRHAI